MSRPLVWWMWLKPRHKRSRHSSRQCCSPGCLTVLGGLKRLWVLEWMVPLTLVCVVPLHDKLLMCRQWSTQCVCHACEVAVLANPPAGAMPFGPAQARPCLGGKCMLTTWQLWVANLHCKTVHASGRTSRGVSKRTPDLIHTAGCVLSMPVTVSGGPRQMPVATRCSWPMCHAWRGIWIPKRTSPPRRRFGRIAMM